MTKDNVINAEKVKDWIEEMLEFEREDLLRSYYAREHGLSIEETDKLIKYVNINDSLYSQIEAHRILNQSLFAVPEWGYGVDCFDVCHHRAYLLRKFAEEVGFCVCVTSGRFKLTEKDFVAA